MHRGAADVVTPYQLVAPINADMGCAPRLSPGQARVLAVAKVRLSMLLGPARILVFLAVLCRFLLPLNRGLARLYCRIILARVTLARCGHDGGINDLSAHRQITLGLEIAVKLIEQPFDRARLGQGLAIEPQGLGIGNSVLQAEPGKTHE